jgi:hypothetical protein
MEKVNKIAIHMWLALTIASLIYALFMINKEGWELAKNNLFIPCIAFVWYLFRRMMQKRLERNAQNNNNQ